MDTSPDSESGITEPIESEITYSTLIKSIPGPLIQLNPDQQQCNFTDFTVGLGPSPRFEWEMSQGLLLWRAGLFVLAEPEPELTDTV